MSAEPVPPAGPIVGFDGSDEVASFGIVPALVWAFRIHEDLKITAEQRQNIGRVRRTSVKAHRQLAGLCALFQSPGAPRSSRVATAASTRDRQARPISRLARPWHRRDPRARPRIAGRGHVRGGRGDQPAFAFPIGRDRAVSARDLGDRRIRNERQGPTAARAQRWIHLGRCPDGWFSSWRLRVATLGSAFSRIDSGCYRARSGCSRLSTASGLA